MKLKPTKKQNPHTRAIVVSFKVNSEEMREILARARAYAQGNVSEWVRFASVKLKPAKEDLDK
jgi:hypothetical protein